MIITNPATPIIDNTNKTYFIQLKPFLTKKAIAARNKIVVKSAPIDCGVFNGVCENARFKRPTSILNIIILDDLM